MDTVVYYQLDGDRLPLVKYINKVTVEPPYIHMRRRTEEFVLYYVLAGEMHLREGPRKYVLRPNDMLILDPHLEHYGTKATTCTYFYVHFFHAGMAERIGQTERLKDDLVDYRLESLRTNEAGEAFGRPVILPKYLRAGRADAASGLVDTLYRLRESHHNHLEHYRLKTAGLLLEFLISLSREMTSGYLYSDNALSTARSTRLIHDLLSFFQSDYASEITGKIIEERCNCNFDYVNRVFKKATGSTIFAYLSQYRIFKARQLLSDGASTVAEAAEKCGFRDIYYFSKVFKKHTGIPPGAYSRKNGWV